MKKCLQEFDTASREPTTIATDCGISLKGDVPVSRSDDQTAELNTYVDAAIARLTDYPPSAVFDVTHEEGERITGNVMPFREVLKLGDGTKVFKCGLMVPRFYAFTPGDPLPERREGDPQHAGGAAVQEEYTAHDSGKTLWKENLFGVKVTTDFADRGDSDKIVTKSWTLSLNSRGSHCRSTGV